MLKKKDSTLSQTAGRRTQIGKLCLHLYKAHSGRERRAHNNSVITIASGCKQLVTRQPLSPIADATQKTNSKYTQETMKHISDIAKMVAVAVLLLTTCSLAQAAYIYRGNSTYSSDILYTYDGRYLYRGRSTYSSDILYTYYRGHVYHGRSTYSSDIVCTWDLRYVYRGNSTYSSDIVCTWDGRYLYRGRSTYSSDIVYTYCNGHVYQGRSTYSSDIVCTTDGHIPIPLLMLIM